MIRPSKLVATRERFVFGPFHLPPILAFQHLRCDADLPHEPLAVIAHAIIEAEKNGARCDICKGKLSYKEHEIALLVEVSDSRELKDIPELQEYLLSIKEQCEKHGFAGFAFKQKQ